MEKKKKKTLVFIQGNLSKVQKKFKFDNLKKKFTKFMVFCLW
jgi:hypothetical protein